MAPGATTMNELSDADVFGAPNGELSDSEVFGEPRVAPDHVASPLLQRVGRTVQKAFENPPEGPSLIGAAKSAFKAFTDPLPSGAGGFGLRREDYTDIPGEDQPLRPLIERGANMAATTMLTSAGAAARRGADPNSLGSGFVPRPPSSPIPNPTAVAAEAAPQVVERASAIDVPIPRYMVDERRMTQGLAAGLQNIPGAGDKIAKAAGDTVSALGRAADRVKEGYGSGSTVVAGSEAKDALATWITEGSGKVAERIYNSVDKLIDPAISTELKSTAQAAQTILDRRALSKIPGESAAVKTVMDAITEPGGLTYDGIKGLRTFIGEMTPQEIISQGLKASEVKQLYGALTTDLRRSVLDAGGPSALTAFNKANSIFEQIATRREQLTKIIGAKGDIAPEAVLARLQAMAGSKSSADVGKLDAARKAMGPEAWNEVASATIQKLGRDPQGEFSIKRFLTAYGNLSPSGRAKLFQTTGKDNLANSLAYIYQVSNHIEQKLSQFYNPSGTAKSLVSTGVVMGILHHPIQTLTTLIGGGRMATVLSEPATAQATAEWTKAYLASINSPGSGATKAARAASEKLSALIAGQDGSNPAVLASQLQRGIAGQAANEPSQ